MTEGLPNWDDIPPEFKERYRADIERWVGAVHHSDFMNDMALLGVDRDSWKARAEALEASHKALLDALEPITEDYRGMCEDLFKHLVGAENDKVVAHHRRETDATLNRADTAIAEAKKL